MQHKIYRLGPGLLPLMLVVSCSVPVGGGMGGHVEHQPTSPSLRAEGVRQFEKIKQTKRISDNTAYRAQVLRVGRRLGRVIPSTSEGWEFVVFEDESPNAFALPGGKVGVNSGIFSLTQNDSGLAAVLGHEMAHVTRAHAQSRVERQQIIAISGAILDTVFSSQGIGAESRGVAEAGGQLVFARPHSRAQELEADRIGVIYMARAGYDPREALYFWRRFAAYNQRQGNQTPEFLRTHPLGVRRLKALEAYLPTAMREYRR